MESVLLSLCRPAANGLGLARKALVDTKTKRLVLSLLREHNIMTIATVRPDGYPQATTVAFANDGTNIYFACDRDCQKVANLKMGGLAQS